MQRGYQVLALALVGLTALGVVAQCGEPATPTSAPAASASTSLPRVSTTIAAAPAPTAAAGATPWGSSVESVTTPTVGASSTVSTAPASVLDPDCPITLHAAVIDRDRQRAWLCDQGVALPEFVVTTARTLPDPGTFAVYAKDMRASSSFGGHYSTVTHFVAFTRGENTGARVAFHTVPVLANGEFAQPLESVGAPDQHGDTSGCIRVLPDQGQVVWDWLEIGDQVRVIN